MEDFTEKLILDDTKIGWHLDRVEKWKRGEKFAPTGSSLVWVVNACSDFKQQRETGKRAPERTSGCL